LWPRQWSPPQRFRSALRPPRRTGSIRPVTDGSAPVVVAAAVAAGGGGGVVGVAVGGVAGGAGGPLTGKRRPAGAATVGGDKRTPVSPTAGAAPVPAPWTVLAATSALRTASRTEVCSAPCNSGTANCLPASRPLLDPCAKHEKHNVMNCYLIIKDKLPIK